MDTQHAFGEPYMKYVQALQEVVTKPDLNARAAGAYREYVRTIQEAIKLDQQGTKEAYDKYVAAVQEALSPTVAQSRARDAFRAYVKGLHEAWTHVDVKTLDAASLAAIAESMYSAAWLGYYSGGGTASRESTAA